VALAKHAQPFVEDPSLAAELARVVGLAEMQCGQPLDGYPTLLEGARNIAATDGAKALELLLYASTAAWEGGDVEGFRRACMLGSTIASPSGDDGAAFVSRLLAGSGAMAEGDAARGVPLLHQALDWASGSDDERHLVWAGHGAFWLGDDRRVGTLLSRSISLARQHSAMGLLVYALGLRARQRLAAQQLDEAALDAREAVELAREVGATNLVPLPCSVLASLAAIQGEDEESGRLAGEALELATARGLAQAAAGAAWSIALLDLGRGRWADALERLEALADPRPGFGDPWYVTMTVPDRIEAAVRAGRTERVREALPAFETWAAHSDARWAKPQLACSRALLAEGDEATALFDEAIRLAADARPFDLARMRLLFGEHLRRERRRTDSRVHLRAALEAFERFRAEPWAERARAELRASGETARKRDPSTLDELTAQELQIARFVMEGATNKEVAAQLFLSKRTVDYHLRKIFTKLGISSRADLIRLGIADRESVSLRA
jgi:ATP/maltotriose-dependent transcriptional regulator MalT